MPILRIWLVLLLSLIAVTPMAAQAPSRAIVLKPTAQVDTQGEKRVALVIGNGAYKHFPLKNPVNDARGMAAALQQCGFRVTKLENGTREAMFTALRQFGDRIMDGGVGLFYFAGHGMQVKGKNYLIPVGADIAREDEVPAQALEVDLVLAKMESAKNRLNVLILDACRNNPFGRSFRSSAGGLAQMDAPMGTYVAFATAPGKTAADGNGANGLYTQQILAHIRTPGLPLEGLFKLVRADVVKSSAGQQMPWDSSSLMGEFYFLPSGAGTSVATPPSPSPAPQAPPIVPLQLQPETGRIATNAQGRPEMSVDLGNGQQLILVQIPAGSFRMGSSCGSSGEMPIHEVRLSQDFWMGKFDVTQVQWQAVMGSNPSIYKNAGPHAPVEMGSWDDCQDFLRKLNGMQSQWTFRLPTEAQWEYSCRAGSTGECYGDLNAIAWYSGNSGSTTHPVGQKQPNAWGLYDMNGNVWQWCQDWYSPDYYSSSPSQDPQGPYRSPSSSRVVRGGSYSNNATVVRSATHDFCYLSDARLAGLGFRVVAAEREQ